MTGNNKVLLAGSTGYLGSYITKELSSRNMESENWKTILVNRQIKTLPNSVYVAIAGEVVNRRSVLLRNFVLN